MKDQSNYITYQIALTAENADKIDQINRVMLGDTYAEKAKDEKITADSKPDVNAVDTEPKEDSKLAELNSVAAEAIELYGEDFVTDALDSFKVRKLRSLNKRLSAVAKTKLDDVINTLASGPSEPADDDFDDDFDDEEIGETGIDPSYVKDKLREYAKEEGRDKASTVMRENGVKKLSEIDKASQDELTAILAIVDEDS